MKYKDLIEELSFAFSDENTINIEIFKELFFESKKDSILQKSFMIICGDDEIDFMKEGYNSKLSPEELVHFDFKSYRKTIKSFYVVKSKKYSNALICSLNKEADELLKKIKIS